jgi:hypothetical protein
VLIWIGVDLDWCRFGLVLIWIGVDLVCVVAVLVLVEDVDEKVEY